MKKRAFSLVGFTVVSLFCFTSGVFAADGWASLNGDTTGGAGGIVVTVDSNAADFKAYVEKVNTAYIVQVSGIIDLNSVEDKKVRIQSNKTIKGIDPNATIIGELGFKKGSSNVIFERLNITNPDDYGEGDGISVKEDINNVFITKCTFYDCDDGLLDITRRSDWVTVSWCKFYFTVPNNGNNNRVNLIGGGDGHTDDLGKLHITLHHNWYGTYCIQRIPSVRFGRVHIYNNYYNCPGNDYCVWSRKKAECLVENNHFSNVEDPLWTELSGKIGASGNVFPGCTGIIHPGTDTVFTPLYSYTLDDANDVPTIVQYGAGADGNDGYPPHWLFGVYGDFDHDDIVDMNDLDTFVDYWLDANDINDADYDGDGNVNFYEFALMAENWRRASEP